MILGYRETLCQRCGTAVSVTVADDGDTRRLDMAEGSWRSLRVGEPHTPASSDDAVAGLV